MRIQQELARDVVVAIEANLFELYRTLGRMPNAWVDSRPDILRVKTGLPHQVLNGIFRARIPEDGADTAIRAALGDFVSERVPVLWWVGPSSEPAHLGEYLENCELVRANELSGMAIDLTDLESSPSMPWELSVERARDEAGVRDWIVPLATEFGLPETASQGLFQFLRDAAVGPGAAFRLYLGRWKGQPVATATLFFGAGVAGIYTTVLPEFRKLGIGAAMSLAPLRFARAVGYRVAITHVPEDFLGFHRRIGFKPYCTLTTYAPKTLSMPSRDVAAARVSQS
ncbi:MAG: GNAT family N-acetyltransferase [Methanobacteriota archaeon]|nr:MAG: GNAT family N-acetyltransferase [Euryarchaeota archaeon]